MRKIVLSVAIALMALPARAQEPESKVALRVAEGYAVVATTWDIHWTWRALGAGAHEANPLFLTQDRRKIAAIQVAGLAAGLYAMERTHRSNWGRRHPKLVFALCFIGASVQVAGGIKSMHAYHSISPRR